MKRSNLTVQAEGSNWLYWQTGRDSYFYRPNMLVVSWIEVHGFGRSARRGQRSNLTTRTRRIPWQPDWELDMVQRIRERSKEILADPSVLDELVMEALL